MSSNAPSFDVKSVIQQEAERLAPFSQEAALEVRILFEHITGKDCVLASVSGATLTAEQYDKLKAAVDRLIKSEPIQYVIGSWSFMGNDFELSPSVLIPRSDTEILCEQAAEHIMSINAEAAVLDLCSGSGCIGISLAKLCKQCRVTCSDISPDAITMIRRNAELNGVSDRLSVLCSDMLNSCGVYDVIVSNPPYIPSTDIEQLAEKVRSFEPRIALDGGTDGLDFYKIIARDARTHLKNGGRLFLEIGCDQCEAVSELLCANGFKSIVCTKDYSGNDRVISCAV